MYLYAYEWKLWHSILFKFKLIILFLVSYFNLLLYVSNNIFLSFNYYAKFIMDVVLPDPAHAFTYTL